MSPSPWHYQFRMKMSSVGEGGRKDEGKGRTKEREGKENKEKEVSEVR